MRAQNGAGCNQQGRMCMTTGADEELNSCDNESTEGKLDKVPAVTHATSSGINKQLVSCEASQACRCKQLIRSAGTDCTVRVGC